MRLFLALVLGLLAAAADRGGAANAQISDGVVRIGVLNDQSSLYADLGGPGSVVAARMAVEDAGGTVLGKPVDIVVADHQNKADIGATIARQWFDADQVDMAVGFDNSSVALAVEQIAAQKNCVAIAGAVGTTAFTGKNCTPNEAAWLYDLHALTTTLARSVVGRGQDTWFFITVDYAFGHSLEADAASAVFASGGKVLGSVRHPLNTADFSSYLLQAQASGAKVVALANGGGDMINATKQANEFGLTRSGQTVVSLSSLSPTSTAWGSRRRRDLPSSRRSTGTATRRAGRGRSAFSSGTSACRRWRRRRSIPPSATIYVRSRRPAPMRRKRS